MFTVGFILAVGLVSAYVAEHAVKKNYGSFLLARATGGETSARIWMQQFETVVTSFSGSPELTLLADELASSPDNRKISEGSKTQEVMRRQLGQFLTSGVFLNAILISADHTILYDAQGQTNGNTLDVGSYENLLTQAWTGKAIVTSVSTNDLPLEKKIRFYAAAPVRTSSGKIIAALLLQLPPGRALFPITSGPTNSLITTYLIDADATVLHSTENNQYPTLTIGQPANVVGTGSHLEPVAAMLDGVDSGTLTASFDSAAGSLIAGWSWIEPLNIGIFVTMPTEIPMQLVKQLWAIIAASAAITSLFVIYSWQSKQKSSKKILIEQELFAAAAEATPDTYIILDQTGKIKTTNEAFHTLLGWTRQQVIGMPIEVVLAPRAKATNGEFVELSPLSLSENEITTGLVRGKSGEDLPVGFRVARLRTMNGSMLVIHDHRPIEKRDKELKRALAEAHAALDAKSRFLSTISHELRSPVASIIATLEMIGEELEGSEHFDVVEQTQRSARLLLGIVEDILDFSSLQSGKFDLRLEPFLLSEALDDVCNVLGWQARKNGVLISQRVDKDIPVVLGDGLRVRQILLNLAGNAIKFSAKTGRAGSVVVDISGVKDDTRRVVVDMVVRDNGIGMSKKTLDRIFIPFEQADTSIKRKYGGTGLGLSITQRLVQAMHGNISVKSTEGLGTEFTVRLIFPIDARNESDNQKLESNPNTSDALNKSNHDGTNQSSGRNLFFGQTCITTLHSPNRQLQTQSIPQNS